jgi:hypothetical protein
METTSVALLMCSPEWRERHSQKKHLDFLKQRSSKCTVLNIRQSCFGCGLR